MAHGEPGPVASLDRWAASAAGGHAALFTATFAALLALSAVAALAPAPLARPLLAVTVVLSLVVWVVAQNSGGILTGQATDPNSGLLLALLALAYLPPARRRAARVGVLRAVAA